ncbi:MAG: phosphotransferase, partial [Bacilli bacterium]|nr:phosphotransferase [Bacilli bacterium]
KMPLRVTHNDTKLNNVMIDDATHQGLAPIDLDTVMPGLAAFDFGDAVRYGANTAAEDEPDITKVGVDIPLFQAFAKGFVEGTDGRLTDIEMDHLVDGAETMAYELCLRFITDYLDGDLYFKTTHPAHNLERAKCQFALYQAFVKEEEALRLAIKEMRK